MFKWFDWVWRIAVVVIAVMVIWKFWLWWRPDPPTTYLRTDLVNAQQSDAFFTGFATVAVVQFDTGHDDLKPFEIIEDENYQKKVSGYCYRLYEVSIGYPSLQAAVKNSESLMATPMNEIETLEAIVAPQVLSGNVVEARHGGSVTQYKCDDLNVVSEDRPNVDRLDKLRKALVANRQWSSHVNHGRNVLTTFSKRLADQRRALIESRIEAIDASRESLVRVSNADDLEGWKNNTRNALADENRNSQQPAARGIETSTGIAKLDEILVAADLSRSEEPEARGSGQIDKLKQTINGIFAQELSGARERLSDVGGYLGSLKLTFSTIGIFGQEKGRWFWKRDEFYVRQDLADATYGSDFALDVSRTRAGLFGPKRLEITVPEPRLLALDRYTTVLVSNPRKFKRKNDDEGAEIENALSGDLAAQLARVEPHAIRFSEAAMTAQIYALVEADVAEVRVRFSSSDRSPPRQLTDLVRLMRAEQAPAEDVEQ